MPGSGVSQGERLPIRFLPSNPEVSHPTAWEWTAAVGWYTIVGVVGAIVIGAVVLVGLLRDRKLARYGRPASGLIVGCTRDGRLFRNEYEFGTERGISMRGKHSGPDEFGSGVRIWILYLPQKPERNSRYPLDFFEVVDEAGGRVAHPRFLQP